MKLIDYKYMTRIEIIDGIAALPPDKPIPAKIVVALLTYAIVPRDKSPANFAHLDSEEV